MTYIQNTLSRDHPLVTGKPFNESLYPNPPSPNGMNRDELLEAGWTVGIDYGCGSGSEPSHVWISPQPAPMPAPHTKSVEPTHRQKVLDEARSVISVDRNTTYGEPEDSFGVIANLWSAYLAISIRPDEVAILLALLKVGRLAANPTHHDSYVDLAGYAACAAEAAQQLTPAAPAAEAGASK